MDHLSPISPARLRALALPVGTIKRTRLVEFVGRLIPECAVRLGDVTPDRRQDRGMFSPLSFTEGRVLYDLVTSMPSPSHLALSPYELFREPIVIIGIADAQEYATSEGPGDVDMERLGTDLSNAMEGLQQSFPRGIIHRLFLFDSELESLPEELENDTFCVPPVEKSKATTLKTIMCDLTSQVLAEMTALAKSIQALPTIDITKGNSVPEGPLNQGNMGARARSASPATDNASHRMSMPVLPSSGLSHSVSAGNSRTGSPIEPPSRQAKTFEEMGIGASPKPQLNRSNTSASPRDRPQDRVSVHGFGPGSITEKARDKGRARVGLVIATMYLQTGCWGEALVELTENTARARHLGDQLWHARGLESIMICLILLSWSGAEFQIPQICYPTTEKPSNKPATPVNTSVDVSVLHSTDPSRKQASLNKFAAFLPDFARMILSIYSRSSTFSGESQPPLAASEYIIRKAKLFAIINLVGGKLNTAALEFIVLGTPLNSKANLGVSRLTITPTRNEISKLLFRAVPDEFQPSRVSSMDYVMILAGIASVFSLIGMHRKRAIILKELLAALIPGLIQARKVGAAEMGLHPAAGLAALNLANGAAPGASALEIPASEIESGVDQFLIWMGSVYGIPSKTRAQGRMESSTSHTNGDDQASKGDGFASAQFAAIERILLESRLRSFGNLNMKLDVLRTCINFCEALPDFQGVLDFTSVLLSIVGPGQAMKLNNTNYFLSLSREEQLRMANNVARTVASARGLGITDIATGYWDFFLVRGLAVAASFEHLSLSPLSRSELAGGFDQKSKESTGPFLHNPFQKIQENRVPETMLVVGEERDFIATLQNPFDFELDIESLSIATEGAAFRSSRSGAVLGPFRSQRFTIVAIPEEAGQAKIIGCTVKVRGCREQTFPIVVEPWRPEPDHRVKNIGIHAALTLESRLVSDSSTVSKDGAGTESGPKFATVPLNIIPEQPVVTMTAVSLQQSALMVLEGERARFSITLKNVSDRIPVNFVHVSFLDSTQAAFQEALTNRSLPMAEVYELEHQLLINPAVKLSSEKGTPPTEIAPRSSVTFCFEVLGKPGLTEVMVRFAYANVGKDDAQAQDKVYTRLVAVPIAITVNASVHVHRADILPFSSDFAWASQNAGACEKEPKSLLKSAEAHGTRFKTLLNRVGVKLTADEYCLLLLDLRNTWPTPLTVSLHVLHNPDDTSAKDDICTYSVHQTIQPGHLNRVLLVLPKSYLAHRFDRITALNPKNEKQFIVSQNAIGPDAERSIREAFWFREELLKMIRGEWQEGGTGRKGDVDLRGIRLSRGMVDNLSLGDVSIEMQIIGAEQSEDEDEDDEEDSADVRQTGQHTFSVEVDDLLTLRTTIRNRSARAVHGILRLQPRMAGQPISTALDLGKRFAWSGLLQQVLEPLRPGEARTVTIGVAALCRGEFEVGACVEEVGVGERRERKGGMNELDRVKEEGKRIWHANSPCRIHAR
ncbi:Trs120-domain-containing protein [Eremomyces bilateralis CBS 781.70]|uniref:Trs120-domain-containing protein n=1 Tax=Eremomyces bilateralis CBS 781.70 TaxID=1392243 RepID=A0A6G1G9D3_9PEZI|nr:Trs120-domain-containing protein [Eremomyces bilateralis CBS 781.70]KAF1814644.1 Trs120-domain-containing protein [Eremomyces bilateralis CBS 781.70]